MLRLNFSLMRGQQRVEVRQELPLRGLTAIFGPSGAGKTTLLRAVAGFERTGGQISLGDEVWEDGARFVPAHLRKVGFVFQEPRLFSHLTVAGNLQFAARRAGSGADVDGLVGRFGLGPLLARRADRLSGGEAQRVALVRALLAKPRLLLMDEPLSALDLARRREILPLIEELRDKDGLPILYVSHALPEVVRLASDMLALADGRVRGFGPVARVLADPAAVAAFGDEEPGSLIEARFEATAPDGLSALALAEGQTLWVPAIAAQAGEPLRLLVRPRDVMLARERPRGLSALNILPARVLALSAAAHGAVVVELWAGGGRLRAQITARSVVALGLAEGTECFAILKSVALARE